MSSRQRQSNCSDALKKYTPKLPPNQKPKCLLVICSASIFFCVQSAHNFGCSQVNIVIYCLFAAEPKFEDEKNAFRKPFFFSVHSSCVWRVFCVYHIIYGFETWNNKSYSRGSRLVMKLRRLSNSVCIEAWSSNLLGAGKPKSLRIIHRGKMYMLVRRKTGRRRQHR